MDLLLDQGGGGRQLPLPVAHTVGAQAVNVGQVGTGLPVPLGGGGGRVVERRPRLQAGRAEGHGRVAAVLRGGVGWAQGGTVGLRRPGPGTANHQLIARNQT